MNSIMQNMEEPRCYVCGCSRDLEVHHCMSGANRKYSTAFGLVVYLCAEHHRGKTGVHTDSNLKRQLEEDAQRAFEIEYDHDLWMRIFRKNYL